MRNSLVALAALVAGTEALCAPMRTSAALAVRPAMSDRSAAPVAIRRMRAELIQCSAAAAIQQPLIQRVVASFKVVFSMVLKVLSKILIKLKLKEEWPMLGGANKPGTYKVKTAAREAWVAPEGFVPPKFEWVKSWYDAGARLSAEAPAEASSSSDGAAAALKEARFAIAAMSPAKARMYIEGAAARNALLGAGVSLDVYLEMKAELATASESAQPAGVDVLGAAAAFLSGGAKVAQMAAQAGAKAAALAAEKAAELAAYKVQPSPTVVVSWYDAGKRLAAPEVVEEPAPEPLAAPVAAPAPAPLKVAEMKGSVKPTARKNPLKKLALMGSKGKADPLPPSGYER